MVLPPIMSSWPAGACRRGPRPGWRTRPRRGSSGTTVVPSRTPGRAAVAAQHVAAAVALEVVRVAVTGEEVPAVLAPRARPRRSRRTSGRRRRVLGPAVQVGARSHGSMTRGVSPPAVAEPDGRPRRGLPAARAAAPAPLSPIATSSPGPPNTASSASGWPAVVAPEPPDGVVLPPTRSSSPRSPSIQSTPCALDVVVAGIALEPVGAALAEDDVLLVAAEDLVGPGVGERPGSCRGRAARRGVRAKPRSG